MKGSLLNRQTHLRDPHIETSEGGCIRASRKERMGEGERQELQILSGTRSGPTDLAAVEGQIVALTWRVAKRQKQQFSLSGWNTLYQSQAVVPEMQFKSISHHQEETKPQTHKSTPLTSHTPPASADMAAVEVSDYSPHSAGHEGAEATL